jgi:hypothetical protein
MTHRADEIAETVGLAEFAGGNVIDEVTLGGQPAWLRIELRRPALAA